MSIEDKSPNKNIQKEPSRQSQKSTVTNQRKQSAQKKQESQVDEDMLDLSEDALRDALALEMEEEKAKPLEGLTFVATGDFESVSRSKLEGIVRELGGKLTSAVSGKTDYLVIGHKLEDGRDVSQGSKYVKAQSSGKVKIITEIQFEELVKKLSGNPDYVLSIRKTQGIEPILQSKTPSKPIG